MNDVSAGGRIRLKLLELSLELKIYNLFNESYRTILYQPMPGRNYQLILRIQI
jgi:iron complex outermembrane receptor protein